MAIYASKAERIKRIYQTGFLFFIAMVSLFLILI